MSPFSKILLSSVLAVSLSHGFSSEKIYVQGFTFYVPSKEYGPYKEEVLKLLKNNGYINCSSVQRNTMGETKKLNIICRSKNKAELLQIFNLLSSNSKYKLEKGQVNDASY